MERGNASYPHVMKDVLYDNDSEIVNTESILNTSILNMNTPLTLSIFDPQAMHRDFHENRKERRNNSRPSAITVQAQP